DRYGDSELVTFPSGLGSDGEWCHDQNVSVRVPCDVLRPRELHRCLAEAAVREDRGPSTLERPFGERGLEVVEEVGYRDGGEAVAVGVLGFPGEDLCVLASHPLGQTMFACGSSSCSW